MFTKLRKLKACICRVCAVESMLKIFSFGKDARTETFAHSTQQVVIDDALPHQSDAASVHLHHQLSSGTPADIFPELFVQLGSVRIVGAAVLVKRMRLSAVGEE